ncbi:MAG: hypothetical protein KJO08_03730 [Gammaproteobacteria bacterium]|nr:hypothetical protein [Gammaproteobacteria bacterium]
MTPSYGIDTSILVRLVTGDPPESFDHCVQSLTVLVRDQGSEVFASNQVIGEAYIALQHHYGVNKSEARDGLTAVLRSGLVSPTNGYSVFDALKAKGGCGLLDRLIADDYRRTNLVILTLDRKMASLPNTNLL